MRWLPLLLLAGCGTPDFSGVWVMEETDSKYTQVYSRCHLEIRQSGDRADLRAWGDNWECEGRGEILADGTLKFRWEGAKKLWRGTCELRFEGDGLRGTYLREDVTQAARQYCRGRRETGRADRDHVPGGR